MDVAVIKNLKTKVVFGTLAILAASFLAPAVAKAVDVKFTNMWVGRITPGAGHVGVDVTFNDHGDLLYNPCHHYEDIYYGACVMSDSGQKSYYKKQLFDNNKTDFPFSVNGNDFPYGIFIDNSNDNYCKTAWWCHDRNAATINHGWGRLVEKIWVEIYPWVSPDNYDPFTSNVGGVKVSTNGFPAFANGGRYSQNIGDITLPQLGQPNVGKLNGFITKNGARVGFDKAKVDSFQDGSTRRSSTGYPIYGFSSTHTNQDGYYNTGPVPSGSYTIYVGDVDAQKKYKFTGIQIKRTYERLDFKLDKPCFGHPAGCVSVPF